MSSKAKGKRPASRATKITKRKLEKRIPLLKLEDEEEYDSDADKDHKPFIRDLVYETREVQDHESDSDSESDVEELPPPPTFGTPQPTLSGMPSEILFHIAGFLPDIQTAMKFSFTNKSMYSRLAGSRYFWFRYGNKKMKTFQKYRPKFNYRKYIMKVVLGKYKTNCQSCLGLRCGRMRAELQKVLCLSCLENNVICKYLVSSCDSANRDIARMRLLEELKGY